MWRRPMDPGAGGLRRQVPPVVAALGTEAVGVPWGGVHEARLVGGPAVRTLRSLGELVEALRGQAPWPDVAEADGSGRRRASSSSRLAGEEYGSALDPGDVPGQVVGRRALEVAASGGHHVLMSGPPGAGKTMLAEGPTGILPPLGRSAVSRRAAFIQ